MKVRKSKLVQIIKEEIARALKEAPAHLQGPTTAAQRAGRDTAKSTSDSYAKRLGMQGTAIKHGEDEKLRRRSDVQSGDFARSMKLRGTPMSDKVAKAVAAIRAGRASVRQGNLLQAAQGLCTKAEINTAIAAQSDFDANSFTGDEYDFCFPPGEGENPEMWRNFSVAEFQDAYMWIFPDDALSHGWAKRAIQKNMMQNDTFEAPEDWQKSIKKMLRPNDPAFDCHPNASGGYDCP